MEVDRSQQLKKRQETNYYVQGGSIIILPIYSSDSTFTIQLFSLQLSPSTLLLLATFSTFVHSVSKHLNLFFHISGIAAAPCNAPKTIPIATLRLALSPPTIAFARTACAKSFSYLRTI